MTTPDKERLAHLLGALLAEHWSPSSSVQPEHLITEVRRHVAIRDYSEALGFALGHATDIARGRGQWITCDDLGLWAPGPADMRQD